jgi:ligand-binding sensor domain-containing protein
MVFAQPQPIVLLTFCILLSLASKEQTSSPHYSVINYNSDNSLPQNSINDMAFDRNGFLWLATEMGMVRFDGQHFRDVITSMIIRLPFNCSRKRKDMHLIGAHRRQAVNRQ